MVDKNNDLNTFVFQSADGEDPSVYNVEVISAKSESMALKQKIINDGVFLFHDPNGSAEYYVYDVGSGWKGGVKRAVNFINNHSTYCKRYVYFDSASRSPIQDAWSEDWQRSDMKWGFILYKKIKTGGHDTFQYVADGVGTSPFETTFVGEGDEPIMLDGYVSTEERVDPRGDASFAVLTVDINTGMYEYISDLLEAAWLSPGEGEAEGSNRIADMIFEHAEFEDSVLYLA